MKSKLLKKSLSIILAVWLFVCTVPISSVAVSGKYNSYIFKIENGEAIITGYSGSDTVLTIPSNVWYEGVNYSVTGIGDRAFYNRGDLKSITIPDSVTSIGDSAFRDCTNLTSITIPDSVTSIGDWAFRDCTNLTSITIPDSVTSIGESAFFGCTNLTSITIPDSVTSIGSYAFGECTNLTRSITIPDSVISIGYNAFYGTGYYNNTNNWENGVLYIGNHLINAKGTLTGSYTIESGTKCIASGAFFGCTNLTSIRIPDSVTSIGNVAFYDTGYYNNTNNWENGVLYIGNHLIEVKDTITGSYTIKSGTKCIAERAFFGCRNLTSITIPDSVTSIGERAFSDCTNLTNITIPDSVTSIGDRAFSDCTNLTSITIPNSLTSIGASAFEDCSNLKTKNYCGTQEEYNKIIIGENNEKYKSAKLKFHVYDNGCDTTCNVCGTTRTVGPHVYDNACDTTCNECGFIRTVGPHNYNKTTWSKNGTQHWHECNVCADKTDVANHVYDNNCDTTCNICGYLRTVGPHVYNNDCDTTCNICGYVRTVGPHTYKITWSNDAAQHWHECSVCGHKTDIENHEHDNACDTECNVCGAARTISHSYEDEMCTVCGAYSSNVRSYGKFSGNAKWYITTGGKLCIYGTGETDNYKTSASVPWYETRLSIREVIISEGITKLGNNLLKCLSSVEKINFKMQKNLNFGYYSLPDNGSGVYAVGGGTIEEYVKDYNHVFIKTVNPATPETPELESASNESITIKKKDGYEYSIDDVAYSNNNTFSGLVSNRKYKVYQRIKENDEYAASNSSVAVFSTLAEPEPLIKPKTPSKPTISVTADGTVKMLDGTDYEYSMDGVTFTDNITFKNLSTNKILSFYRRQKPKDNYTYSDVSSATKVLLVSAPIVSEITETTATVVKTEGYVYSVDNIEWNTTGVFKDLVPGEAYTVYQKPTETQGITVVDLGTSGTTFSTKYKKGEITNYSFLNGEVVIITPKNMILENSTFDVKKIVPIPSEIMNGISMLGNGATAISYYEIRLIENGETNITNLSGKITIKIKLPKWCLFDSSIKMYQKDEKDNMIEMCSWREDFYICYNTDWLEIYQ